MLIVVQAGHAGRTTGATGAPGEQNFNIEARSRAAVHLVMRGYEARGIGADEPDSAYKGDAFFAIHADGSTNPDAHGASVGYQTQAGKVLATVWKNAYVQRGWTHGFQPDNYTTGLAQYYGVRHAVEVGNKFACIVEAGFITSPYDGELLASPTGPDRVGLAIADTVDRLWKPPTPNPQENKNKMLYLIKTKSDARWWLTDWLTKRHVTSRKDAAVALYVTAVSGAPISTAPGGGPHVLGDEHQGVVDRIPRNDLP